MEARADVGNNVMFGMLEHFDEIRHDTDFNTVVLDDHILVETTTELVLETTGNTLHQTHNKW